MSRSPKRRKKAAKAGKEVDEGASPLKKPRKGKKDKGGDAEVTEDGSSPEKKSRGRKATGQGRGKGAGKGSSLSTPETTWGMSRQKWALIQMLPHIKLGWSSGCGMHIH